MAEYIAIALAGVIAILSPLLANLGRRRANMLVAFFLGVLFLVPTWLGIPVASFFVSLHVIALGLLLIAFSWAALGIRIDSLDLVLLLLFVFVVASWPFGGANPSHVADFVAFWVLPYAVGRIVGAGVSAVSFERIVAPFAVVVSVWAIIEFAFHLHIFESLVLPFGPSDRWASIQTRGTFERSEGAFGHSIALGAALGYLLPFVLSKYLGLRRLVLAALLVAASFTTLSRSGLIAAGVGALMWSWSGRRAGGARAMQTLFGAVIAGLVVTFGLGNIDDLGGDEVTGSSAYRQGFWSLLGDVRLLGASRGAFMYAPGRTGYVSSEYPEGFARSIDSTALLLALRFGWIAAGIFVLALIVVAMRALKGGGPVALIGAGALIPVVSTTAMITQIPLIWWVSIGLSVTWLQLRRDGPVHNGENEVRVSVWRPGPHGRRLV